VPHVSRARQLGPVLLLVALAVAACASTGEVTFDPAAPCTSDGQFAGAYPELEAALPTTFEGAAPARRDSGRNCTETSLGTLAQEGIAELRFAGALWETGRSSGVTMAVFEADGLTAADVATFYEAGARSARRTERIETGSFEIDGSAGQRLDALVDTSYTSIVVFPGTQPDRVRAVLVASEVSEAESRAAHDTLVERAAAALLAGDGTN
jgi:hypothetical protein